MARRNEHSLAEIKSMVLDAAESIIQDEGFSALTIRKIAMEMGYTVGSIYMVFASRAELILHLNARTLETIVDELSPIQDNVELWLKTYLNYIRQNTQRWQMIFMPSFDEDIVIPDWYQQQLDGLFQQFAAYFSEKDSQLHAVQALWLGIHGICLLAVNEESESLVLSLLQAGHYH